MNPAVTKCTVLFVMWLHDLILLLWAMFRQAIERAEVYIKEQCLPDMEVEVETRTLDEVDQVCSILDSGTAPHVTRVMLDNMAKRDSNSEGGVDVSLLKEAVHRIGSRAATEASGNVTLETVRAIASTGVTYISCGALTHSVQALDISLNIQTR